MTRKTNNNDIENTSKDFHRLSIQISLNGLSFCVLDTVANRIVGSEHLIFHKELTPYQTLKELQQLFKRHQIDDTKFSEVVVIHRNNLFSLVPKSLFDEKELANYLKFNAKILANDHIAYDELEGYDLMNVYVPFVNINNYIYDLFGEFIYKHHGTVMVQSLLDEHVNGKEPVVYVHVFDRQLDITVITQKKLLLFNNFEYSTQEDFLYYLLFTLEQLGLNPESVPLKMFGDVGEDDPIYRLCYEYVKDISILLPAALSLPKYSEEIETIDFTVLNAL
ncbi:DUF3822 family protein [Flavobacteriaceae bacterium TP-CH-4]|uniref:DUF3822 family protein n=1 Tax=Pelagihabitans pacificus TaxID=2696054 RepID=A0A967ATS1_9FLAO|nr:DUF3822 family protein [Pelagihabitans pacificus]NHF59782.1 DUF3822 family protein [Pelagihabitans pacificus]